MKRHKEFNYKGYEVKIRDYQYKSRPPVGVSISGTRLGEDINLCGEPCYYFHSLHAMSMNDGERQAIAIINTHLSTSHDTPG